MRNIKVCSRCSEEKPHGQFPRRTAAKDGRSNWCKACHAAYSKEHPEQRRASAARQRAKDPDRVRAATQAWRSRNKDAIREYNRNWSKLNATARREYTRKYDRLRKYGLTPEQWDALFASQGEVCAACGTDEPGGKDWHTDHCHESGAVRGILCQSCNLALGFLKDKPERVAALYAYISRAADGAADAAYGARKAG